MKKIIGKLVKKAESIEECNRFLVTAWSSLEDPHFANFEFTGYIKDLEEFLSELAVKTFDFCEYQQEDVSVEKENEYYQMSFIGVSNSDPTSRSSIKFYAVPKTSVPVWNLQFISKKKEENNESKQE